jgi:hypothetical protein
MIRRKSPKHANLKPRKPIPRVNVKRKAANHERAYGEKAAWIRELLCAVCANPAVIAAHVISGGMARKAGSDTLIPLCCTRVEFNPQTMTSCMVEGCHEESHRGVKTFQKRHEVNLQALAAKYEAEWLAHTGDAT